MNTFSKVAGYKIDSQKSIALPYTNDICPEKEIMETFATASSNIKYLGVSLTQQKKKLDDKDFMFMSLRKKLKKLAEFGKISHADGYVRLTQ